MVRPHLRSWSSTCCRSLLRPGRFDVTVNLQAPDKKGRREILNYYLAKIHNKAQIDADRLAELTAGLCGAEIENLINQAALKAVIDSADSMTQKHIEWAQEKIEMGA